MNPSGTPAEPHYDLVIRLSERTEQMLILQDQTASRTNLTLNATFQLYQRGNSKPVLQGTSRATTSYDLLNDEFATIQSTNDAHRRGALTPRRRYRNPVRCLPGAADRRLRRWQPTGG